MTYRQDLDKLQYYILKDIGLTDAEAECYMLKSRGRLTVAEIAEQRNATARNISNHLHKANQKIGEQKPKQCLGCASFRTCEDASVTRKHQAHICLNYKPIIKEE